MNTITDQMTLEEYAATTSGPLASVWSVQEVEQGYSVKFPNGGTTVIAGAATKWDHEFEKDLATSRLWFHSLTYAPYFYWDFNDWDTTEGVLTSYASHLLAEQSKPDYTPINSLDHAHAVQLLVACSVYASLVAKGELSTKRRDALVGFIEVVGRSALQEGMIKFNNHGMMLTRALANVAFVFKNETPIALECGSSGISEFDRIIEAAFDRDGIVNENTPAYQILYMRVVEAMIAFVSRTGLGPEFVEKWKELMVRAKESLALQLLPDGTVPPIGDDAGGKSPYPSKLGELYSPENGLFVHKDESVYMSIISGYRGVVHKHFDDTSIRLQYQGTDLIIDSGLLNYDVNDPIGVSVVSQRGHSGLFFPKFDHMRPLDAFLARPPRQTSWIDRRVDLAGHDEIACGYIFDGDYSVERLYTVLNERTLFISDSFASPDKEVAIQRFNFPGSAVLQQRQNALEVIVSDVKLTLWTEYANSVRFYRGSTGSQPKGWRAVKFYESEPCWSVEVWPTPGKKTIKTALAFGGAAEEHNLPVTARAYWHH